MERTLSRRAARRLIRGTAVALALVAPATMVAHAGSVAGNGGATEITQLLNHAELVTSAIDQLNTVHNTLQGALYLEQSLKQLDPSTIAQMTGFPVQELQQLAGLNDQVTSAMQAYQQFQQGVQGFQQGSQYMNMTPEQYLNFTAQAAQQYGGIYQQQYQNSQAIAQNLQQQLQQLNTSAAAIPGITSQVAGMQGVMTQNTQTQALLIGIQQQLNQANQNAALQQKQNADAVSGISTNQASRYQKFIQVQQQAQSKNSWALPDPTAVPLTQGAAQ